MAPVRIMDSRVVVLGLLLASVLSTTGLGPAVDAKATPPGTPAHNPATIAFPSAEFIGRENYRGLIDYLVNKLGLPPLRYGSIDNGSSTQADIVVNPPSGMSCCLVGWGDRAIILTNTTDIYAHTIEGPWIHLWYSEMGRLIYAEVTGKPFGNPLPSGDDAMFQRLRDIAVRLGLPVSDGRVARGITPASESINGTFYTHVTRTVYLYLNQSSLPVALGNEVRMTFDLTNGLATAFGIFPWFTAPAPVILPSEAYSAALDHLNHTIDRSAYPGIGDTTLVAGTVYLALDSHRYSLVYQVEARYVDNAANPSGDYRVWVDAYDGSIVYAIRMFGWHPNNHPDLVPGGLITYGILGALAAAAVSGAIYLERLRMGIFSLLLPLYFKLKRERTLDHFVRGQVYGYIVGHPGAYYSEVRDVLDLNNGAATHHLYVLVAMGFLRAMNDGRHKRFFPVGVRPEPGGRRLSELQSNVLAALRREGPLTPVEVARSVGVSRQRARYNLARLGHDGLVARDSHDRRKYLPTEINRPIGSASAHAPSDVAAPE